MSVRIRGFTLVEVLVVIGILLMLVALLLPALQAAREAARIVQCKNHLKQQSLSCLNFESANGKFPGYGGELFPIAVDFVYREEQRLQSVKEFLPQSNWMLQVQPYLESGILQATGDTDEFLAAVVAMPFPVFNCPTRREARAYPLHGSYQHLYGDVGSRTDYALNGGATKGRMIGYLIRIQLDGIWMIGKRASLKHITDGTSNTYLIGEKSMDSLKYQSGDAFGDASPIVGHPNFGSATNCYVRYGVQPPRADAPENCLSCHDFGSAHRNGWNAAMCDGSVRTLSYSASWTTHRARSSIAGSDAVSVE